MTFGSESTTDEVLDGHRPQRTDGPDHRRVGRVSDRRRRGRSPPTAPASCSGVRDLAKGEEAAEPVACRGRGRRRHGRAARGRPRVARVGPPFTDGVLADHDRLDVLVANAGRDGAAPRARPPTASRPSSAPTTSATSCSSTGSCRCSSPARRPAIVNLRSGGHRFSDVDLDDPNFERTPYDPWVGLRPVEDGQRPVRGRARPTRSRDRACERRRAPRGDHHRARPPPHRRVARRADGARGRPASRAASGRRRAPPRPCGPASWPTPTRSAGATARTARCRELTDDPAVAGRLRLRPRPRPRRGAVGPLRGAGGRVVPDLTDHPPFCGGSVTHARHTNATEPWHESVTSLRARSSVSEPWQRHPTPSS